MTSKLGDEPAFPVHPNGPIFRGMTYRQWLVGMALQGMLANEEMARSFIRYGGGDLYPIWALSAIKQADAVLAELEKH